MTTNTNPAMTAGPNADGSKSLAPESKAGTLVQFVVTTGVTGLLAWATNLDTSSWTGYAGMVGVAGVGLLSGLATAFLKRNR